jgi:CheY-like chemotaxis protein
LLAVTRQREFQAYAGQQLSDVVLFLIRRATMVVRCGVVGEMTMDQQASSSGQLQGLRVLAAEDEPMLLMALEDMLDEFGCHVVGSAATVAQALEMGTSKDFDVAILDVNLARETVDPAARAIVARGIPVVLATGHVASDVGVRLGAASVVEKPYTPAALQKALVSAVFPA